MPVTKDGKISYEFVPGIFTTALFAALRNQDRGIDVYLILEEMSRGDIASIFGDIFQLLDRDDTGKSMYGINNKSIYEYLILNGVIKAGHKIIIPSNLHIIGTVNTSDQNVNVIDTAFKRRFDFKYIGVDPIPIHVDGKDDEKKNEKTAIDTEYIVQGDGQFTIQVMSVKDRDKALAKRAKEAKCSALMVTVDLQVLGNRHRDIKNGLSCHLLLF